MGKIIGIDLGTKNSMAAVIIDGKPTLIPNSEGEVLLPSVVAMNETKNLLVGKLAKSHEINNGENTISSIKRLMGPEYNDLEVKYILGGLPYKTVKDQTSTVNVKLGNKQFSPVEISALILTKIRKDAELFLGDTINQAIISVPSYFNRKQRQATLDAGKIAGLDILRVINESIAPAMTQYFLEKKDKKIVSISLGAGFLSISIIDFSIGFFEVISTKGDNLLGGVDFDHRITEHVIHEFKRENHIDLNKDQLALQRIREASEKARIELSTVLETEINLPCICKNESGFINLSTKLTREKLGRLTGDLVEKINYHLRQGLADAHIKSDEIDDLILNGGMTRMPAIVELINKEFKYKSVKCISSNEMVAKGAAILAGILGGDFKNITLLDATPLTLSLETQGGVATPVIERNCLYPAMKSQTMSSTRDLQTSVEVHVLEGERPMAIDNTPLGRFVLDGIPPAPHGVMQVKVTFDLDRNGILDVTATDQATGRSKKERIPASDWTAYDIERAKIKLDKLAH